MAERQQEPTGELASQPPDAARELDASRQAMLRDVKQMSIEERLDLLEPLQRDAARASRARRVR